MIARFKKKNNNNPFSGAGGGIQMILSCNVSATIILTEGTRYLYTNEA